MGSLNSSGHSFFGLKVLFLKKKLIYGYEKRENIVSYCPGQAGEEQKTTEKKKPGWRNFSVHTKKSHVNKQIGLCFRTFRSDIRLLETLSEKAQKIRRAATVNIIIGVDKNHVQ